MSRTDAVRGFLAHCYRGEPTGHRSLRRSTLPRSSQQRPFEVIFVWQFSRFTHEFELAIPFKSLLRKKRNTEHAEDTHTGKLTGGNHRDRGQVLLREPRSRGDARDPRGFVPLLGRHPGSRSGERLYIIGQQLPVIVIP